ncbi:MAG: hypothetical protein IJY67_06255 [Paludibacteraceae bacterium]|nr:hypothetical protein [Paludibacteraceae bacterium]
MKKCALQIVSLCIAIFIAYISGGLNIYHYCCDACKERGHDIFQTISCEEVHASHHCSDDDCHHSHHNHTRIIENQDDLCAHLMANSDHCDVHHIDAPYFSQFNPLKVNIVSPLVAIFETIHNSQFIIHDYEYEARDYDIPIVQNLTGRAIIVRKSAYLI